MDLKELQTPLKERYRADAGASKITLTARGSETDAPVGCSVDLGRAIQQAEAHTGVGGPGTAACSGDLLLGALAACAQITCQMVATAMGIETERIEVVVGIIALPGRTRRPEEFCRLAGFHWWQVGRGRRRMQNGAR